MASEHDPPVNIQRLAVGPRDDSVLDQREITVQFIPLDGALRSGADRPGARAGVALSNDPLRGLRHTSARRGGLRHRGPWAAGRVVGAHLRLRPSPAALVLMAERHRRHGEHPLFPRRARAAQVHGDGRRADLRSPSTVPIPRSHPMAMSPQAVDRPAQAEWADLLRQPASRLLAIPARMACPACWPRWLVVRIPRLLASLRATLRRASDPRHSPAMPTSHRPAATVWLM